MKYRYCELRMFECVLGFGCMWLGEADEFWSVCHVLWKVLIHVKQNLPQEHTWPCTWLPSLPCLWSPSAGRGQLSFLSGEDTWGGPATWGIWTLCGLGLAFELVANGLCSQENVIWVWFSPEMWEISVISDFLFRTELRTCLCVESDFQPRAVL